MSTQFADHQIEYIKERCNELKPLVAIRCITFNHEAYLKDALEGFVSQQTDFPFVAIVHDDASSDRTPEILKEYAEKYPDIIFPIFEIENQHSKHDGSLGRIMDSACEASAAKYITWCEGDDYWMDHLKLQKQVYLLRNNPEATACYSAFKTVDQKGTEVDIPFYNECMKKSKSGDQFEDLIKTNYILTCTFMAKHDILDTEIYQNRPNFVDHGLFLTAAYLGPMIFLDEPLAAYRINTNGMIRTQLKRIGDLCRVTKLYFWENAITDNHLITKKIRIIKFLWETEYYERSRNKYKTIFYLLKRSSFYAILSGHLWLYQFVIRKIKYLLTRN